MNAYEIADEFTKRYGQNIGFRGEKIGNNFYPFAQCSCIKPQRPIELGLICWDGYIDWLKGIRPDFDIDAKLDATKHYTPEMFLYAKRLKALWNGKISD